MRKREKLIHAIAARYISNKDVDIELTGKSAEIDSLVELLEISKKLKNILDSESSTLEEINNVLLEKKEATKKFTNCSGITWRL